jgi:hypothetical protein
MDLLQSPALICRMINQLRINGNAIDQAMHGWFEDA